MIEPNRGATRTRFRRSCLVLAMVAVGSSGCTPFKNVSRGTDSNTKMERDGGALEDASSDSSRDEGSIATDDARTADGRGGMGGAGSGGAGAVGGARMRDSRGTDTGPVAGTGGGPAQGSAGSGEMPDEPPRDTTPLDPSDWSIDSETADGESLALLSDWSRLPVFGTGRYRQQSSQDRGRVNASEASVYPVTAHGNRDFNNFLCKSADADTGSGAFVEYGYDAPSCAESYVRGVVLSRFEGSGRMTRLWMTVDTLYYWPGEVDVEVLRIYVDDNPRAMVQVPLQHLLAGTGELFARPFGRESEDAIAWRYPIVFNRKLLVVLDRLRAQYYYQTDVVLDAEPRRRTAPRQRLGQRDAAHALLMSGSPVPPSAADLRSDAIALAAGAEHVVELSGPATIQELRLRVPKAALAALRDVRVSVAWDGASAAAIDAPLLDLFAASHAVPERSNLALAATTEADDQILALRLPMPFRTSAIWKVRNGASTDVSFRLDWIGEATVPDADFGHLHLQRNEAQFPARQLEQTVAEARGRGRFVGMCGNLGGHRDRALSGVSENLDLLQGDIRATADGEKVLDSTGTEDYGDSAFYFRESPMASPFTQVWGRTNEASMRPPGRVSFCRWQVLGTEIDFQSELKVVRELAQFDTSIVELHHTLAFLYLP